MMLHIYTIIAAESFVKMFQKNTDCKDSSKIYQTQALVSWASGIVKRTAHYTKAKNLHLVTQSQAFSSF